MVKKTIQVCDIQTASQMYQRMEILQCLGQEKVLAVLNLLYLMCHNLLGMRFDAVMVLMFAVKEKNCNGPLVQDGQLPHA